MSKNGILSLTIKKRKNAIEIKLPDERSIKIYVKDHKSGNDNLANVILDCPKDIKINRIENENIGNH